MTASILAPFHGMSPESLHAKKDEIQSLLRSSGVTFSLYDQPHGLHRTWPLDPIPLPIISEDWARIERGLMQRAEIFDLLLKDFYGPNNLVRKKMIPHLLVLGHPGFLRALSGANWPSSRRLTVLATDLVRNQEGTWMALGDRAQAPSGAGYALENRIVLSKTFPSLYRDAQVHRIVNFFRSLRRNLWSLARRDNPLIALWTPGPAHEAWFEHAFLADYLGIALVESQDLFVSEDRVWMRSLEGIKPVDVLLRRVFDTLADPLELRSDSVLGVPGLARVARLGNCIICNPLGSGVLQNPSLMAYLPALSRHLLGEDLLLPSIDTWWLGDLSPPQRESLTLQEIFLHKDDWVIRTIHPVARTQRWFPREMTTAAWEELRGQISANPAGYVAQRFVEIGRVPCFDNAGWAERRFVLRAFQTGGPEGYTVFPGGLGRVAPNDHALVVSNQDGGLGKDIWITASEDLASGEINRQETLARFEGLGKAQRMLGAGSADNIFWMARYFERSHWMTLLLRHLHWEELDPRKAEEWPQWMLQILSTQIDGLFNEAQISGDESLLRRLASDPLLPGSLAYNISRLQNCGRQVRDMLGPQSQQMLLRLDTEDGLQQEANLNALGSVMDHAQGQSLPWLVLQCGRQYEKCSQLLLGIQRLALDPRAEASACSSLLGIYQASNFFQDFQAQVSELPWKPLSDLLLGELETGVMATSRRLEQSLRLLEGQGLVASATPLRRVRALIYRTALFQAEFTAELDPHHPQVLQFIQQQNSESSTLGTEISALFTSPIRTSIPLRSY